MNRRSLQPSKESIQHFKRWNLLIVFYFSWFLYAHLDPYPDQQHWILFDKLVLGYLFIYLLHPCLMHKQINVRLTVQSTGKLWKKTEWPTARTNQTPDTGDIFFLISKLCRIRMTICIGPCRVQQRRRSRAHQKQQEIPGSAYPDHEVRPWKYPITPPGGAGDRVLGATKPPPPLPPPPSGQPGQGPTTPLHRAYPFPKKTTI